MPSEDSVRKKNHPQSDHRCLCRQVSLTDHNGGLVLPDVVGYDCLLGLDVEKVDQRDVLDVFVCCLGGGSHVVSVWVGVVVRVWVGCWLLVVGCWWMVDGGVLRKKEEEQREVKREGKEKKMRAFDDF